ncbi:MAG: hypothetical protein VW886_04355 [Candidatus Heimdallarchaeota archaeon]
MKENELEESVFAKINIMWMIWLIFLLYAILIPNLFLPEDNGFSRDIILATFTFNLNLVDPSIFMIFSLLGVLPLMCASIILFDNNQKLPSWPFLLASLGTGVIGLLPYLALRDHNLNDYKDKNNALIFLFKSKIHVFFMSIITVPLVYYGLINGDFSVYFEYWKINPLVHVMTIDFVIFYLLLNFLIYQELKVFNFQKRTRYLFLLPMIGFILYFYVRIDFNLDNTN